MYSCLICLHLFTLPMLALPSFIQPRSTTQLPGKHVSNQIPPSPSSQCFHEGAENKPSRYYSFLIPWTVSWSCICKKNCRALIILFSYSHTKYPLLDKCGKIYFCISGIASVNCFASLNSCWNFSLMVAAVVLVKNQTVKCWPFEDSATDLNSHGVTRASE